MHTPFSPEAFMSNILLLAEQVRDAVQDLESAQSGPPQEPRDWDEKIAIEEALSTLRSFLETPLRQMAQTTLFALEHLNACGMAKDLRKRLKRLTRRDGWAQLRSLGDDDDTQHSPIASLIRRYADAVANSFEFDYGHRLELHRLESLLEGTRSIMLFRGISDPGKEGDVRDAVYEFLRVIYDDVVRDKGIGQSGKTYKPDIGVKHLRAAVEYKYVGNAGEVNTAVDGIYADVLAYTGSDDWRWFFAVIYMTDQHVPLPELRKRFERLPENWKMVIVVGNGERRKRKNAKPVDSDKP